MTSRVPTWFERVRFPSSGEVTRCENMSHASSKNQLTLIKQAKQWVGVISGEQLITVGIRCQSSTWREQSATLHHRSVDRCYNHQSSRHVDHFSSLKIIMSGQLLGKLSLRQHIASILTWLQKVEVICATTLLIPDCKASHMYLELKLVYKRRRPTDRGSTQSLVLGADFSNLLYHF